MTHKHKKRCEMCRGTTKYSQIITAAGNRTMYLCQEINCSYAQPIKGKYL